MALHKILVEMLLLAAFGFKMINSLNVLSPDEIKGVYYHIKAHFGEWNVDSSKSYKVVVATPGLAACRSLFNDTIQGNVVLILRGVSIIDHLSINHPDLNSNSSCTFTTKVLHAQQAGAIAVILGNNVGQHDIVPMYEDMTEHSSITIPSMSVSKDTYLIIYNRIIEGENVKVKIDNKGMIDDSRLNIILEGWITAILSTLLLLASVSLIIAGVLSVKIFASRIKYLCSVRQRGLRIHTIPTVKYSSDLLIAQKYIESGNLQKSNSEILVSDIEFDTNQHEENVKLIGSPSKESKSFGFIGNSVNEKKQLLLHNDCNVCLNDFVEGEDIKLLNCKHAFHENCIKTWIIKKGTCPICKRDVFQKENDFQDCS